MEKENNKNLWANELFAQRRDVVKKLADMNVAYSGYEKKYKILTEQLEKIDKIIDKIDLRLVK